MVVGDELPGRIPHINCRLGVLFVWSKGVLKTGYFFPLRYVLILIVSPLLKFRPITNRCAVLDKCSGGGTKNDKAIIMKPEIHPNYADVAVNCSCGNTFKTRSTLGKDFHVDVCSECHPFYTGKQKMVDTGGRIDRFTKRFASRIGGKK